MDAEERHERAVRAYRLHLARHGTLEDKFWARVKQGPGCWQWLGGHDSAGYGILTADGRAQGAHRASWEIHNGPIPDGLWVLHHCDVPECVRPDHLFLGTALDNVRDMDAKGRGRRQWPVRRGEDHYAARLSDAAIADIRDAVAAGERHRTIAGRYSISRAYVGMLAQGRCRRP